MARTLGPRDIGGILGDTFRIYGSNFLRLIAVIAIVYVPLVILGAVRLYWGLGVSFVGYLLPSPYPSWTGTSTVLIIVEVTSAIVSFVAGVLMAGAAMHAVSQQHLGLRIRVARAYRFALKRLGPMLGGSVLYGLAVVTMAITLVGIPAAVYFGVRWGFVQEAALLEGLGPRAALSRSSTLVKANWWRVFGITVVVSLIAGGGSALLILIPASLVGVWFAVSGTATLAGLMATSTVVVIVAEVLFLPIFATAGMLLYYDLRVRKEGYSLDELASELQLATGGGVPLQGMDGSAGP